ncbi:Vps53-like protein [Teladorsagia circumcincta]|uniref:Vps53-like protein n=1 Tax=Teladorsagia circumcincta TaxID=45464 RepID=A0A2G9UDY9_TELCI|nr:Vps53-like protein [Teladorsagia circumcincta]
MASHSEKASNLKPLDIGMGEEEEELKLSLATEAAIKEMCHSEFCRPDQELTAQINELFPTEQSLAQLDTVIAAVESEIHDLDVELAALVESHDEVGAQGEAALQEAQKAMSELERRIDSIRGKTRSSDEAGQLSERVTDMCRVAAALEGSVKSNFCRWFIDQQLSEYTVLYAENEEGAWLDKIEERYKWYVRKLTDFERTGLAKVFPPDWDMGRLMTKEFCNVTRSGSSAEVPSRECSTHAVPFSSSADMFLLLKKVITECSKLSSEPDALLKDVVGVVRVCLRNYAHGCLTAFLPTAHGQQSGSSTANLFNLIREDTTVLRLSADQQFLTCCILATADWCAETTLQLQEKLAQRLAGVDLSQEMETFYGITNQALAVLVQDLEGTCDAALQAISKITWSTVDGVGDESPFVGAIRSHLRAAIPRLRDLLSDRRKYFAHLCLKLATQLSHKFVGALFRCKPISTHGAEQLLLDTHSLKSFLLQMPSIDSAVAAKPPTAYVGGVGAALNKAEMILKLPSIDLEV